VPELIDQRLTGIGGNGALAAVAGLVVGVDEAAQRALGLGGPMITGVAFGGVLKVAQQVNVMPTSA
jgi:hypothetical protein